ncbi:ras-like protein family member 12 isoform X2 [Taeniopygia guttata]|uniref:ras-like protein family member 12 isoform X2 n=1 Tax=Taeniopygia guttata TaxID=59729 RepID=UPI003BB87025
MSSPASDRTEGPGLGCWGHGEELRAHESPGTWRGGHQAEAPQVSLPEAGGARGAGVCSAGGTVLGVAGAACPAPRRGSFPYKEFGWSPSSGSRARLRLPHSSQPRPCGGRCCPGPALTESPASPPALACKDRGCPRCSANPETAASGRPRVPSPSATWPSWGAEGPASQVRRAGQGIGELPGTGHLPHLPLSPPVALTVKFLTKRFISEYDPNLEDTYSSEELVDQQPVLLKVMDTADQDGPRNCERYLCWASAFLVVYSIDNRKSFEGCQRYLEVLALHARGCQRRCPVLLLGNKLDMEQYREGTIRTHRVKQQAQPTSEGTQPGEGHSHHFTPCSWNTPAACGQTPPDSYKLTQQPVQQECPLISANSPETWSSQQRGSYISSLSPVMRRHLLQAPWSYKVPCAPALGLLRAVIHSAPESCVKASSTGNNGIFNG